MKKETYFCGAEGRTYLGAVNALFSWDKSIYAECPVPEGASDEYGYLTMKKAIIEEMEARGMDTSEVEWFYVEGIEDMLEDDADADCDVFVDITD